MPEWERLGDDLRSGAAAASWGAFETQIFAIRPDGGLWNRYWDGERWHDWESLGDGFTGEPAASARGVDRIDVFGIGTDGRVLHRWWDGAVWVPWEDIECPVPAPAAVSCSWVGDRLDVFVRAADSSLWYATLSA